MGCKDKHTNICVDKTLTTCIDHEGELGKYSKIEDDCKTQYDVNEDLYILIDEIKEDTNVVSSENSCINIPVGATIGEVVALYETKICELNKEVEDLSGINYADINITNFGLIIPECIVDSCDKQPETLGEWMQVVMDKINCN